MLRKMDLAGAVDHEHFMAYWFMVSTIVNIVACCLQTMHKTVLLNAHIPIDQFHMPM